MKKLTIENIIPYLPYDLQFSSGHYLKGVKINSDRPLLLTDIKGGLPTWEAKLDMVKPLLIPLKNYKDFSDILFSKYHKEDFEVSFLLQLKSLNRYDHISYEKAQLFLKHHIDIFQLIENNLAEQKQL